MPYNKLQRDGIFRVTTMSFRLSRSDSGAVGVNIGFRVDQEHQGGDKWETLSGPPLEVFGYFNLIKKDGTASDRTCKTLVEVLGWDGDIETFNASPCVYEGIGVQVHVECETYNGKQYYKAGWMAPWFHVPREGKISEKDMAALKARFAPALRSACSDATPPKEVYRTPVPQESLEDRASREHDEKRLGTAPAGDDIPF